MEPSTASRPTAAFTAEEVFGQIEALRGIIDAQGALIESLQQQLVLVEREPSAAEPDVARRSGSSDLHAFHAPTSRRSLMTKGAAGAVGVALATTVAGVVAASPAAAASGTFDGDPGVKGVANPIGGVGVFGTADGTGGRGVVAEVSGVNAIAIEGDSLVASGATEAVRGNVHSTSGRGVAGIAVATDGLTFGVYGQSESSAGHGVHGVAGSPSGATVGVYGSSASVQGTGVHGIATEGSAAIGTRGDAAGAGSCGVMGNNNDSVGAGVYGVGGTGVRAQSNRTQLALTGSPAPPLGAGTFRNAGEVVFDANADLWVCVADGTPGAWRRVASPNSAGALTVLDATTRIYDSRPGSQPPTGTKTKFQSGDARPLAATGNGSGVPGTARAVMISATATNTNPGGFFSFYKTGIAFPGNSNLNWGLPSSTVAVTTVVACGAGATFNARMQGAGGADLIVDVIGYYL